MLPIHYYKFQKPQVVWESYILNQQQTRHVGAHDYASSNTNGYAIQLLMRVGNILQCCTLSKYVWL